MPGRTSEQKERSGFGPDHTLFSSLPLQMHRERGKITAVRFIIVTSRFKSDCGDIKPRSGNEIPPSRRHLLPLSPRLTELNDALLHHVLFQFSGFAATLEKERESMGITLTHIMGRLCPGLYL